MNDTIELLNFISQNAKMGVETLSRLVQITQEEEFKNYLTEYLDGYQSFLSDADKRLKKKKEESKDLSPMAKVMSYLSLSFNTMIDKSPSHVAEMVMQGCSMGIIDITKRIKQYSGAEKTALTLAEKLLKFEQKNFSRLQKFL